MAGQKQISIRVTAEDHALYHQIATDNGFRSLTDLISFLLTTFSKNKLILDDKLVKKYIKKTIDSV